MTMFARNDVGSIGLAFSSASFRRKIIETVSCGGSRYRHDGDDEPTAEDPKPECRSEPKKTGKGTGSEKLSELLRISAMETEEKLKKVVKKFQSDEYLIGAIDVRRLTKDDSEARTKFGLLGAISPLVALLESEDLNTQIASLYALLNLGIGNDINKAAIVKAGAVHKMLNLIESSPPPNPAVSEAIVANFLGLSALDSNKPIIGSSGAIPFLVKILKDSDKTSPTGPQAKHDSLRGLYNLSISPSNFPHILETNLIPFLLNALGGDEEEDVISERILSILSNVVSTPEGRKAVSAVPDAFPILIDVLSWTDLPRCQEKATYILMVMAHKAHGDRHAMIEAGIVSSLLELTLLGTPLAQKRASRILECLRIDKGKQVSENFAPIGGGLLSSSSTLLSEGSEERKAVKQLVQQSLQNNMRRIVKRANLGHDFVPSDHFKSLTMSSTSKSLPF